MPFYTPNGLKIRIDPFGVNLMLGMRGHDRNSFNMLDVELNTELWVNLPNALSNVGCLVFALWFRSWLWSMVGAMLGYGIGYVVSNIIYSPMLRRILPQFLGGWIIALTAAVIIAIQAGRQGEWALALVVPAIVIGNWCHYTDVLLLFLLPIGIGLRRSLGIPLGWAEFAFVSACNEAAERIGIQLDWSVCFGTDDSG